MWKHSLFELFKSFSIDDLKKFDIFLKSPYFNSSDKMYNLYKQIIQYYPDFKHPELTKENLSVKSSVSGRYNESTLRDALSELMKLVLRYLSISNFERNSFDSENYLLDELLYRKANKAFLKRIKNRSFNDEIDAKYLYNKYWYNTLLFNYDIIFGKVLHKKDAENRVEKLKIISFDLHKFYISEFAALYLNSKLLSKKYNIDFEEHPLNLISKIIDLDSLLKMYNYSEESALIHLYKLLLAAYDNFENSEYYYEYRNYFNDNILSFSSDEIAFHYNWMINYCILKKKSDDSEAFNFELFELYKKVLVKKFYHDNKSKYLSIDLYRDIMVHGLHLKQIDWTINFIKKYHNEVIPDQIENILHFSYTYFYCHIGNYSLALEHYNKIIMDNFVYKYDIKNLVIRMYYELNYWEEAICEIKSFREFLRNNEMVNDERRTRTGKYLRFFERLIIHRLRDDKTELTFLKRRILDEPNIAYKDWLISKVDILI